MADWTGSSLANVKKAIWSDTPTITFRSNVVNVALMDHTWEPELGVGRGNLVNVYGFTQNTGAANRGAGTGTFGTVANLTFTANSEGQTQLTVNRFYYMADRMAIENQTQVIPSYIVNLAKGRGHAIGLQIDADIASDSSNGYASYSTKVGSDNVDVTEDSVLTVETNLNKQNAPMSDRYLVVSPATRGSLLQVEAFRNQLTASSIGNLNGGAGPGAEGQWNGYFGHILTFDCIMSNNLAAGTAGTKNVGFYRQGIAYAAQLQLQTESNVQIELGVLRQYVTYTTCGIIKVKSAMGNELDGK